ncbi:MAG: DUF4040 domain-containing protein [Actinomycetota bacterium]|nr:DUF4040 domain-containing protein [Actinomycetota bacterium]
MSLIYFLVPFLLVIAVATVFTRDLLAAVIIFSAYSLIMAVVWQQLGAPVLALAEVAIGAGVTVVLFVVAVCRTTREEKV